MRPALGGSRQGRAFADGRVELIGHRTEFACCEGVERDGQVTADERVGVHIDQVRAPDERGRELEPQVGGDRDVRGVGHPPEAQR